MTAGFLIAAPASGSGKSMITTGLMAVFAEEIKVQGFKVGPDFIDPMYHRAASGRPSYNLDPWMLTPAQNWQTYNGYAQLADLCITEGVMGLFDATGADPLENSTAGIARLLGLPVILVVDCTRMSGSAAALIHGFHTWSPEIRLSGVICNRVASVRHERLLREAVEQTGVPIVGMVPNQKDLVIPSRHLGLFTVTERESAVAEYIAALKPVIRAGIDLPLLLQVGETAAPIPVSNPPQVIAVNDGPADTAPKEFPQSPRDNTITNRRKVRIGMAYDQAFCFYYESNLQLLREAGAELVLFSPMTEEKLPDDLQMLILGGGYPELYAQHLAENHSMLESIRAFAAQRQPIYAECGGLIYLTEGIHSEDGVLHPLTGILPGVCHMQKKLIMGYRTIRALYENWLFPPETAFRGHEFHYSVWENPRPEGAFLETRSARTDEPPAVNGYAKNNILASYVHIHFAQNPLLAQNFIRKAQETL